MNTVEKKIEKFLKSHISKIEVPRTLFENIMKNVTIDSLYRNIDMKVSRPSPYQLTYSYFMKKIAYIGIPVVVVALIAIIAIGRSNSKVAYQDQTHGEDSTQTSQQTQTFTKDSSIDSIAASFNAGADADATTASSESEDGQALDSDLQNYNNIQNYDYQNNF
jgi:D-mannonate dehydratase